MSRGIQDSNEKIFNKIQNFFGASYETKEIETFKFQKYNFVSLSRFEINISCISHEILIETRSRLTFLIPIYNFNDTQYFSVLLKSPWPRANFRTYAAKYYVTSLKWI